MCSHLVPSSSQVVWSREPMAPDSCTTLPWPCPGNLVLLSCVRCPWVTGSWRGRWWCTARNRIFIFYASHCSQLVLVINGRVEEADGNDSWIWGRGGRLNRLAIVNVRILLWFLMIRSVHSELIDKEGNLVFIHSLTWTTGRCIKYTFINSSTCPRIKYVKVIPRNFFRKHVPSSSYSSSS